MKRSIFHEFWLRTASLLCVAMMTWSMLLLIISFITVAALLGIVMYSLICLSDLENDFINPHDSAARINMFVLPEFYLHTGLTIAYLIFGFWFMFLINTPLLFYHIRIYLRRQYLMDVTEIFNQLFAEKKYRFFKLAFYLLSFVIVIYRLVVEGVTMLIEDHGLPATRELLKEATV